MELRSRRATGEGSTAEPASESRRDRIERWRSLAIDLKVEDSAIPNFVAEQLAKEDAEWARLALERAKLERENEVSEQRQKREFEEKQKREQWECEERQRREREREEEELCEKRERERKRLEREEEEHNLRMQVLAQGARPRTQGDGEHPSVSEETDEDRVSQGFRAFILLFDEVKEEIATWLRRFERVANVCKWAEDTWATRVSTRLTGKAAELYNSLDDEAAEDYVSLKAALLMRYQLTAKTYRQRFWSCKRKESKTYAQYGARIVENLTKWQELSKITELKQLVLLEQFLQSLSPEMTAYIWEKESQTLAEAVRSAEIYFEAHGRCERKPPQQGRPQGGNQGAEGKANGGKAKGMGAGGQGTRRCYICQSPKHLARDCSKRVKTAGAVTGGPVQSLGPAAVPTLCLPCSRLSYDPRCTVTVDGVRVQGLRDTGSQVCVVKHALVAPSKFKGRKLEVAMSEASVKMKYPVVRVMIDSPFYSGDVEAVVMESPAVDFIIGNHALLSNSKVLPVYAQLKTVSVLTCTQATAKGKEESTPLHVVPPGLGEVTPERLRDLQRSDPTLRHCREAAERGTVSLTTKQSGKVCFVWKNGLLYREFRGKEAVDTQVVVLRQLRPGVLRFAHEPSTGGHMGVRGTSEGIWKHYYWPGMCPEARRYVSSCDWCRLVHPGPQRVPEGRVNASGRHPEVACVNLKGYASHPRVAFATLQWHASHPKVAGIGMRHTQE